MLKNNFLKILYFIGITLWVSCFILPYNILDILKIKNCNATYTGHITVIILPIIGGIMLVYSIVKKIYIHIFFSIIFILAFPITWILGEIL